MSLYGRDARNKQTTHNPSGDLQTGSGIVHTTTMLNLEDEIREVMRLRDDENLTFKEIGDQLGFSESTAKRRYKAGALSEAANELIKAQAEEGVEGGLPETQSLGLKIVSPYLTNNLPEIERFKPMVLKSEDVMVTCDWHIPLYDADLVNSMFNVARENEITKLAIGGDFFNLDSFSSYLPHQPEAEFVPEKLEANIAMKTALLNFEEIWFIWGNHDFRITKFLGFKHSFVDCMKWILSELTEDELSRIHFSDLDHMVIKSGGRDYRLCHPQNFSSVPLTVAKDLAIKYNMSIITAHSHHCAMGVAKDGRNLIIEGGGFFSKNHTEYIKRTNKHHEWVQGYTMFKDGIPNLFSPAFGNTQGYMEVK